MGRRPTSSTKSGRFMNPADAQRKVDRRKELKRNKKQRVAVRSAVLKSKDCEDIIAQMQKLDEMEFDLVKAPILPERVIGEKRTKMRETFLRVLGMYKKEGETDKLNNAKRLLHSYDAERNTLLQNFFAEKFAKESNPADIPLPGGFAMPGSELTPSVPMLPNMLMPSMFPPHMLLPEAQLPNVAVGSGILKKRSLSTVPPGPPSGLPPVLSDSDGSDSDEEDDDSGEEAGGSRRGVRFADGVDDEEKDTRTMYKNIAKRMAAEELELGDPDPANPLASVTGVGVRGGYPPPPPVGMPAGYAVSASSGGRYIRAPPPPPPGLPARLAAQGAPVTGGNRGPLGARPAAPPPTSAAVISAEPTVQRKPTGPVIEAKPQLRNMQKEVVKLIPTAIRVRRELRPGTSLLAKAPAAPRAAPPRAAPAPKAPKDDAYEQFMKEMSGIM